MDYQAEVFAFVSAYLLSANPLDWFEDAADVPVAIATETGGPGDDIRIETSAGKPLEVQVKHGLQQGADFWSAIERLAGGLAADKQLRGVLIVDTTASQPIRTDLRNDLIRVGQGRTDQLKQITIDLLDRLLKRGISDTNLFERLRIVVKDLEQAMDGRDAALTLLRGLVESPGHATVAWSKLVEKGHDLIAHRGRETVASLVPLLRRHVKLSRSTGCEAIEAEEDGLVATATINDYCQRFKESCQTGLAPLVSSRLEIDGETKRSDAIQNFLELGQHGQLIGNSGMGKSHHAKYMALAALDSGQIPIVLRARDFSGELLPLLDRSIAHLCPETALKFIRLTVGQGRRLLLVVDGFNECPADQKDELVRSLQAFYLRGQTPIFFTSQDELKLPRDISGPILRLCDLDDEERLAVLRAHATTELPSNAEDLCRSFRSAYELSLAASCFGEIDAPNRAVLFDAYVRRCCHEPDKTALVRAVLTGIADAMRRGLKSSLPQREACQIAEDVLAEQKEPTTKLKDVMESRLLDVRNNRCAFRHEMLQRFFESLALRRSAENFDDLLEELSKPAHHDLVEFVLGMQIEEAGIRACLSLSAQLHAVPDLVGQCIAGHFGNLARSIVREDITRVLAEAEDELELIDIRIKDDPYNREKYALEVEGCRERSAYEHGLLGEAILTFDGDFFASALRLVSKTERRCIEILSRQLGDEVVNKRSFQNELFWKLFVIRQFNDLPGTAYVGKYTRGFQRSLAPESQLPVVEILRAPDQRSLGEIYLCLRFLEWDVKGFEDIIPGLLRYCWNTGVYNLRLEALERVRGWAQFVSDTVSDEIRGVLSGLNSSHIFLSNAIIEAMCAYSMVESPVSPSDASQELAEILASQDCTESLEAAYNAVTKIFEDVFDGAYSEAIESLPPNERMRLYIRATLGAPSYGFFVDWLLEKLIKCGDESSLSAFLRFTSTLDVEALCSQTATASFILAHVGSAKYLPAPGQLLELTTDDQKAWQYYGEIIFWQNRPGLTVEQVRERCEPLWKSLESEVPLAAVDPLMRFAEAMTMNYDRKQHPVQKLFAEFRQPIRRILEGGLRNRAHLSAIDKRMPAHFGERNRTTFIVHTLGQIGTDDDIRLLEPLVNDGYHGRDVVEAIRQLQENKPFERLNVLHRFP